MENRKSPEYLDGERFVTREKALSDLLSRWSFAPETEIVYSAEANGRICAEDVFSLNTLPVFRSAQADGIAVRFVDFAKGVPDSKNWQEGVDYAMADTGDDFDDAFDTVIQVEDLVYDESGGFSIVPEEPPITQGQLIHEQGSTLKTGELLVKAGTTLRPLQLCLLAAGGILNLPVIKKPTVAYIPTGNELIPVSATPQRGQNIESNGAMIGGFLSEWGANIRAYPIIRDDSRLLEETLNDALQNADIVLINGGSSMGSQDYTIDLLERRGSFLQHGIKSIPGIPVALAIVEGKPIINLPGPPFAAFCVMDWCVRALVCKYKGQTIPRRQTREVVLSQAVHKPVPYDFYLRLHICKLSNGYEALPLPFGSRFAKAMNCNGLTVIPIGVDGYEKGSVVEAELLYGEADLPLVTEG